MKVKEHLELLGFKAEDKVTGFSGVITSISFDLFGCIQAIVSPPINEKGEVPESRWHDISRLKITSSDPVMEVPNFEYGIQAEGKQGPAEKPRYLK